MQTNEPITLDKVLVKSDTFIESSVDGEAILMDLDRGSFSALGETGLSIWKLLDTPKSAATVCEKLLEEYQVEPSVCQQQTLTFLNDLHSRGLIRVENGQTDQ